MLGNFLSCSKGVKDLLEVPEVRCDYLPEASAEMGVILALIIAAFSAVPTGLSHVPPCCESILGVKAEAAQGKQVPLQWTETSGGLLEWWHDAGVPLAFPVESASS